MCQFHRDFPSCSVLNLWRWAAITRRQRVMTSAPYPHDTLIVHCYYFILITSSEGTLYGTGRLRNFPMPPHATAILLHLSPPTTRSLTHFNLTYVKCNRSFYFLIQDTYVANKRNFLIFD